MLVHDRFSGHLLPPLSSNILFDSSPSLLNIMDPTSSMSLLPGDNDPASFVVPNPTNEHDAFVNAEHPTDESMYFLFPNTSAVPVPTEVLNPHIVQHHSAVSNAPPVFSPDDLAMGLATHISSTTSTATPVGLKRKRDNLEEFLPAPQFYSPAPKRSRTEILQDDQQLVLGTSPTSPTSNDETPIITPVSTPAPSKPKSPRPSRKTTRKSNILSNSPRRNDNESGKKRLRTLTHMQSLARSHAPEVSLSSEELLEIANMREDDEQLAMSAELYRELVQFKNVLATHGYKLSALTIDPITEETTAEQVQGLPVDLVLKRRVKPSVFVPSSPYTGDANLLSPITPPGSSSKGRKKSKAPRGADDKSDDAACAGVTCVICSKTMNDRETLVRHFRHVHQELKPYNCPRCKGPYSSEGTLWHHIRNVHSETPRKFRCSQCDASYDSFGAKTRHEHATHNTDEPEFVCTFDGCNRAFNFPAHLESHALSDHPGFKPFGCTKCKKRFNSANGLIRHKREVHQSTRAYSCSCGTTFKKKDHLKRHLLQRHSMSYEKATEEMKKQPSPGLVQFMPPAAPAAAEAL